MKGVTGFILAGVALVVAFLLLRRPPSTAAALAARQNGLPGSVPIATLPGGLQVNGTSGTNATAAAVGAGVAAGAPALFGWLSSLGGSGDAAGSDPLAI